jgi:hypothetical protein
MCKTTEEANKAAQKQLILEFRGRRYGQNWCTFISSQSGPDEIINLYNSFEWFRLGLLCYYSHENQTGLPSTNLTTKYNRHLLENYYDKYSSVVTNIPYTIHGIHSRENK